MTDKDDDTIGGFYNEHQAMDQSMPITLIEQWQRMIEANHHRCNAPSNFLSNILEQALELNRGLEIIINEVLAQDHNEHGADNNEQETEQNQDVHGHDDSVLGKGQ